MNNLDAIITALESMKNNQLRNYIVPGLNSHLIGGPDFGKVRLFSAERETREFITPHSHRFDFTCLVLRGYVYNTLFKVAKAEGGRNELWHMSTLKAVYKVGVYEVYREGTQQPLPFYTEMQTWKAGDTYSMTKDDIHSIKFERGTEVLFFEGPTKTDVSHILEPWVNGKVIPTFRKEPWMFEPDTYSNTLMKR